MYKTYVQSEKDPNINDSFYYDSELPIDTAVLHNNMMHKVIHIRKMSDIYSSKEIKDEFIRVLNKTYHGCTDAEMDYIIYSLDKKTVDNLNDMNHE